MGYVPLWVKTNGSLLEGASHPEELVDRAAELGLPAIAITDRDSVAGLVRAWKRGKERGVRVLVGAQVTVGEHVDHAERLVLLAETREGYGRLCRLLTLGHARMPKGESCVTPRELAEAAEGLLALAPTPEALRLAHEAFGGRLYALVTRHLQSEDARLELELALAAARLGAPLVAGTEVLYHERKRQALADVLTCIRHRVTLREAGTRLRPNAEHALLPPEAMRRRFRGLEHALDRTHEVAARAAFQLSELRYRYPAEYIPEGQSEQSFLESLTFEGAKKRYGERIPREVRAQLRHELELIRELDYGGYFLTMWDVVQFCESRGILCQGRGSAANSAVCYCLGITAIDPVRMKLLFERFISRERAEPPDIDLDIEHQRREEVIQYVYARWGRRRAAMVANVIRYRRRSALRDVSKVLELPPEHPRVAAIADAIEGFPRHLSIHPGGFLLGAEPVDTLVPIEPATMPGRTVIQWDKRDVEDLGLFKVDLLGLGMLTQIHRCFDLLRAHEGLELSLATIPPEDPATYEMLSRGDSVGVFQVESRAQMSMLPRLKPKTFYDLVVQIAIVRPGPIQGGMVHPYLKRREGLEPVTYPHPSLQPILEKTLGVPIFQEQVMKLAVAAAGYTPGEADQLRRDMAAWGEKGRIEAHEERLVSRMIARGIPKDFAEQVFSQIRGFGEYGFPESHSASFAILSYVSAWLKCHHHAAFTCALLDAWPMGFYAPSTLVEDAKRHGIEVRPIDVSHSGWNCSLEPSESHPPYAIRMGLRYVKGLGERERERLEAAPPPYADLADFAQRTKLGKRALLALAEAGAFASFGLERRRALWAVRGLLANDRDGLALAPPTSPESLPRFAPLRREAAVRWDYETSMHSTHGHPMAAIREPLRARGIPTAAELNAMPGGRRLRYVGLVICRQRPHTARGVTFMTLEDETGFVNVVIWADLYEKRAALVHSGSLFEVRGRLQRAHGVVHLVAEDLAVPSLERPIPRTPVRDFH